MIFLITRSTFCRPIRSNNFNPWNINLISWSCEIDLQKFNFGVNPIFSLVLIFVKIRLESTWVGFDFKIRFIFLTFHQQLILSDYLRCLVRLIPQISISRGLMQFDQKKESISLKINPKTNLILRRLVWDWILEKFELLINLLDSIYQD